MHFKTAISSRPQLLESLLPSCLNSFIFTIDFLTSLSIILSCMFTVSSVREQINRTFSSYSRYWTGTSLQLRLIQEPPLHASSSPLPRIQYGLQPKPKEQRKNRTFSSTFFYSSVVTRNNHTGINLPRK